MKKLLFAILLLTTGALSAQKHLIGITDKDGNFIENSALVAGIISEDFIFEELTANRTLVTADFTSNKKVLHNSGANDYIVRVPDLATEGKKIVFKSFSSGKITVYMEPGVIGEAFETAGADAATMSKGPALTGYFVEGNRNTPTCIPDTNEFHTDINAASDPYCEEANLTTGFTPENGTILVTSDADSNVGSFSIKGEQTTTGAHYYSYSFSASAADTYTITWDSKKTQGVNSFAAAWQNIVTPIGFNAPGDGVFEPETENITVAATGIVELRFYSSSQVTGSLSGDNYFVDNLSIVKTN